MPSYTSSFLPKHLKWFGLDKNLERDTFEVYRFSSLERRHGTDWLPDFLSMQPNDNFRRYFNMLYQRSRSIREKKIRI